MGKDRFVQMRVGLLEHLPHLSGAELKVYMACHFMVDPFTGVLKKSLDGICEKVGASRPVVSGALKSLHKKTDRRPAFIVYKPARNQWELTEITILKYKKSAQKESETAPITADETAPPSAVPDSEQQLEQQGDSTYNSTLPVSCGKGALYTSLDSSRLLKTQTDAPVSSNGSLSEEDEEALKGLLSRWHNKRGKDQEARSRFRNLVVGRLATDKFLIAADHYITATAEDPPNKTMQLENFIGTGPDQPWQKWVAGDPNAEPYCTLNDGTRVMSKAEAKRMLDAGEIKADGDRWVRT